MTKRRTPAQRQQIIDLARQGYSFASIARQLQCNLQTVRRWAALKDECNPDLGDKPRGRLSSTVSAQQAFRIRRLAKNGYSTRSISMKVKHDGRRVASKSTVHRVLAAGGLLWLPVMRKRVLSESNKKKRVEFCNDALQKRSSEFSSWIFIDAKDLYLYRYPKGRLEYAWHDVGSKAPSRLSPSASSPYVFRFYAAVGLGYKSPLYFVPPSPPKGSKKKRGTETFKSQHFVHMLTQLTSHIASGGQFSRGYKLLMDNAKQHTSSFSREAIKQLGIHVVEGYPAQSWDLNVIENCWGMLNNNLTKCKAESADGWRKRINLAWEGVQQGSIDALVMGMRARIQSVLVSQGEWVPHH